MVLKGEALFYKNVIDLVVLSVSCGLPCVLLQFFFLKSHNHHYQIMLLAEDDEHLAPLVSSTESKWSYQILCRSTSPYHILCRSF